MCIDASVKVGELLRQIPLGNRWNSPENAESDHFTTCDKVIKNKSEAIDAMGLSNAQAYRYQMLALYPDIVEIAKRESRETKKPLSMRRVIQMIMEHRRGCRVAAADFHQYTADKLTSCETFDRKTKAKVREVMMRDGRPLVEFLAAGRRLRIDDYYVECYLRSDGVGSAGESVEMIEELFVKLELFKVILEGKCKQNNVSEIRCV